MRFGLLSTLILAVLLPTSLQEENHKILFIQAVDDGNSVIPGIHAFDSSYNLEYVKFAENDCSALTKYFGNSNKDDTVIVVKGTNVCSLPSDNKVLVVTLDNGTQSAVDEKGKVAYGWENILGLARVKFGYIDSNSNSPTLVQNPIFWLFIISLAGNLIFVALLLTMNMRKTKKPNTLVEAPKPPKGKGNCPMQKSKSVAKPSEKSNTEKSVRKDSSRSESRSRSEKTTRKEKNIPKEERPKPTEMNNNQLVLSAKSNETTTSNKSEIVIRKPDQRNLASHLLEPVSSKEFEYFAQMLTKFAMNYRDNPHKYSVTVDARPGFLFTQMPNEAPILPEDIGQIIRDMEMKIVPGLTHWHHPQFHAYYTCGRSYPDILAEIAVAALGQVGFSWDSSPALTELEHAMMNWVGRAFGIPEVFLFQGSVPEQSQGGGTMKDSASDAVSNALIAARQWKIRQLAGKELGIVNENGISYDMDTIFEYGRKLVAYTSKDAHSCMEKGCKLAMMRCRPIQAKMENDFGVTGEQLEKEILKDIEKGLIPAHVHVTLGTTSSAANDHLESIWPIAEKYKMWIHVDAAYAGSSWICPENRTPCKGLEHAHSINVNGHKWLLHSAPCTFFWTREQKIYKDAFCITPSFLKPTHANATDLRDWGVSLTRSFKGLKTWFIMRMYGVKGLQNYIRRHIELCEYFQNLVSAHPNCTIFTKRILSLFTFQYVEPGFSREEINKNTQKLCQYFNESHKLFFTHTQVNGNNLIRVTLGYELMTSKDVEESWRLMKELISEFQEKKTLNQLHLPVVHSPLPGHKRVILKGDMDCDIVGSPNQQTDITARTTTMNSAMSPSARTPHTARSPLALVL